VPDRWRRSRLEHGYVATDARYRHAEAERCAGSGRHARSGEGHVAANSRYPGRLGSNSHVPSYGAQPNGNQQAQAGQGPIVSGTPVVVSGVRPAVPGGHDAERFMLALAHQGAAGPRKGPSPPVLTPTCPCMCLLFGLDMRTPASGTEAIVPVRDLPADRRPASHRPPVRFASWAGLRRDVAMVIQPVTSPRELARAFEPIGARRARLGWSRTGISCSWPAGSGQTGR
jgi:hypothetical protein